MRNIDEDDITVLGRMPVGGAGDPSEFDFAARDEVDLTPEQAEYLFAGDDVAQFESPVEETFPLFSSALRRYKGAERPSRALRVDTDETYGDLVSDAAVREIDRRLSALEEAFAKHEVDAFAHPHEHVGRHMVPATREDVLGVAESVSKLKAATTPEEVMESMPQVPLDLPEFARGAVKCWRDGDAICVSIRFSSANDEPRIATMAARPRVDESAARWAMQQGADPTTVLGALDDLAAVATGKRLVRDVAGCALKVRERTDVLGMAKPVMLVRSTAEGAAPIAATMHVQQLAESGNLQAKKEMAMLHAAAMTPTGLKVAAPVLVEADRRLNAGRAMVAAGKKKPALLDNYARAAGWIL